MASAGDRLLAAAAVYVQGAPRKVIVVTEDRRVSLEPLGKPTAAAVEVSPMPAATGPGRWFSPEEELIVQALAGGGWHTAQQLADATGQPRSSAFMTLLSNLARRDVLESSTRRGYRLAGAPDQQSD